jgi:hypothetical protein
MKIETDMRNLFFRLLWGCDLDSLWQAEGGLVSHRLFSLPAAQLISHLGQTKTKTRKKKKKPREPGRKIYIRARKEEKSKKRKRTWFGAAAWMNRFNHGWSDRHLLLKLGGKVLDSIPKANGGEVWNRIFLFLFLKETDDLANDSNK